MQRVCARVARCSHSGEVLRRRGADVWYFSVVQTTRKKSGTRPKCALRVLILEDDIELATAMRDVLSDEGWSVVVCAHLSEARAELAAERSQVLVLDLTLSDAFGADFLEELRARPDAPRVVIVSGFPLADLIAERHGVELVKKPFESEQLVNAVRRVTRKQGGMRRAR